MSSTEFISISHLELDRDNPRLSEFGINEHSSQRDILEILWDEMDVKELMHSIVSSGFWEYEPLIAQNPLQGSSAFIVLEGNRRLGAVKLIHDPTLIERKIPDYIATQIEATPNVLDETLELPVIRVHNREEAWKFIGFKHVNGPVKWGSYAKAKYIAEVHNTYAIPLSDIAYQIGDTNYTVQKLYQGLMVLEQAYRARVYSPDDIQANRIYFSHLYTGLQREGIRSYLSIKGAEEESQDPVPSNRLGELGQLLEWLYGSKKNNTQPIVRTQNPDLRILDKVLQSREALAALVRGEPLNYAYELSRESHALFEENLLAAKGNLQKARAYLTTGYKGEESLLRVAGSVANLADDLYEEMDRVHREVYARPKRTRLTDSDS